MSFRCLCTPRRIALDVLEAFWSTSFIICLNSLPASEASPPSFLTIFWMFSDTKQFLNLETLFSSATSGEFFFFFYATLSKSRFLLSFCLNIDRTFLASGASSPPSFAVMSSRVKDLKASLSPAFSLKSFTSADS